MASRGSDSDPIPQYYEDEILGGFEYFYSDDEDLYDFEEPGFPVDIAEDSESELEDPVFEVFNVTERQCAFDFVVNVEVEEGSDSTCYDEMDIPGPPLPQQDAVDFPCQSSPFEFNPPEDRMEVDSAIQMFEAVSPLSLPRYSRLDQVASATRQVASSSSRGGHSGRGRGSYIGRWKRGDELVEKYPSDEDFPPNLAEEIGRVQARHERNARAVNVRRVTGSVSEEEALFYEMDQEEFKWEAMDSWQSEKERFLRDTVGPSRHFADPYDAFRSFWDD